MTRTPAWIAVSNLRPSVGERVQLELPWPGSWPAEIAWEGVDASEGATATLLPEQTGSRSIRAGALELRVAVQALANEGPLQQIGFDRALPELRHPCEDRRFPALAGPFALGCSAGAVDLVVDLRSGRLSGLEHAVDHPGLGPGLLYAQGKEQGLWTLPAPRPSLGHANEVPRPLAAPVTNGKLVAWPVRGHLVLVEPGASTRNLVDADSMPWHPPALADAWVAWVDGREQRWLDTDIWAKRTDRGDPPFPLARAPGPQSHIVGDGPFLAWTDGDDVRVEDMRSHERRRYPAATGFRAGLGLWEGVACWEDRGGPSLDVHCSDGLGVQGSEDEGWPSREGPWLLYRKGNMPYLRTLRSYVIDDDDPRAITEAPRVRGGFRGAHVDGPLRYEFRWWPPPEGAGDWCLDHFVEDGWRPAGTLVLRAGRAVIDAPGDAVRLRLREPGEKPCEVAS
jgi:hypothetical protein